MTDLLHSPAPRSATDLFGDPSDPNPPQWLNPSSFLSPDFDSEAYISDLRTFVPLDTLRGELRSHLSSLQRDLVDLINRDYADFVSLSTKLTDVDAAVVRMRAPLLEIREKIVAFRESVEASLMALRNRLKQRADADEAREVLELLLDTAHVVSKVEKLIKELPTVPADLSNGYLSSEKGELSNGISSQYAENGTNLRETQSMLLERIASEMNRLKFYTAHAQNMPFIENMEKRIQNASSLLDSSLGHCFVDGLEHKDSNVIFNCLRAYAAIDNTEHAEEIFRSTVVAPFVKKVIPYTSTGVIGEASTDDLEEDYAKIKKYIDEECKLLLKIASTENSGLHAFSFLANSVLKEVLLAIEKGKPGVFSPGRPREFLKNYKSSLEFLTTLEGYCPTRSEVTRFRSQEIYVKFLKQWNLGVYFSLRFQEIAGSLDSELAVGSLVPVHILPSEQRTSQDLILKQCVTLLECLNACWSDDFLVLSCSDKFLRLFLQLISRFSNWVSAGLRVLRAANGGSYPGSEYAASAIPDDLVYIIHDLNCLVDKVSGDCLAHVHDLLSSCSMEVLDLVKHSILQGGKSLSDIKPLVMDSIIETIVEKSTEDLKQMKGITATYRMTNKPLPVRHSQYVTGVLRPLKAFLDGEQATTYLTDEIRSELLERTTSEITNRYYELASDLVSVARKTETSLLKIRAQRRAGGSSDVSDHNISDTDKMCMQLFLDVQEYGRNLSHLGVEASKIPAYCSLWKCVAAPDRQNNISF